MKEARTLKIGLGGEVFVSDGRRVPETLLNRYDGEQGSLTTFIEVKVPGHDPFIASVCAPGKWDVYTDPIPDYLDAAIPHEELSEFEGWERAYWAYKVIDKKLGIECKEILRSTETGRLCAVSLTDDRIPLSTDAVKQLIAELGLQREYGSVMRLTIRLDQMDDDPPAETEEPAEIVETEEEK